MIWGESGGGDGLVTPTLLEKTRVLDGGDIGVVSP